MEKIDRPPARGASYTTGDSGTVRFSLLNDELTSMTQIQLFTLSGQDTMIPLCEKVQISTSADQ
jgi:hypothetical protein